MKWHTPDTAPKDGSWLRLHVDCGEGIYSEFIGRFSPRHLEGIGVREWEVKDHGAEAEVSSFRHASCIAGWMPT